MQRLFLFCGLLAMALGTEIYYAPPAVPVVPAVFARHAAAVVPLAYTRVHAAVPAVETYNSVQTPDSFQQQYRSDYKPLTYAYYH